MPFLLLNDHRATTAGNGHDDGWPLEESWSPYHELSSFLEKIFRFFEQIDRESSVGRVTSVFYFSQKMDRVTRKRISVLFVVTSG